MKFIKNYFEHQNVVHIKTEKGWEELTDPKFIFAVTDEESEEKSIYGKNLKPLEFRDLKHYNEFVRETPEIKTDLYGIFPVSRGMVFEKNLESAQPPDYQIAYYDIETTVEHGFPDSDNPVEAINMITVKRRSVDYFDAWTTCKDTDPKMVEKISKTKIKFRFFETEEQMLTEFCKYFGKHNIDIYSGWNSDYFDLPYIAARTVKILGKDIFEKISPFGIYKVRPFRTKWGEEVNKYDHKGIDHVDLMDFYKKFVLGSRESYSLDFISKHDLGEGKLVHESGIPGHLLYRTDPSAGLAYNIVDVQRLEQIDKKNGIIDLAILLSQMCHINIQDTLMATRVVMSYMQLFLLDTKEFCPADVDKTDIIPRKFEGGYVKKTLPGRHKYLFSADIASEYPSAMRAVNISPEMKGPKLLATPDLLLAGDGPDFDRERYTRGGNGQLYRRDRRGIIPRALDSLYAKRVVFKKCKLECEKLYEETKQVIHKDEAKLFKIKDSSVKVILNSFYGALAAETFIFYDPDVAESVTLTGQLIVKTMSEYILRFLGSRDMQIKIIKSYCKKFKYDEATIIKGGVDNLKDNSPVWIATDTDSCYIGMEGLVKQINLPEKERLHFLEWMADGPVQQAIGKAMQRVEYETNALVKDVIKADREVIGKTSLFVGKKAYSIAVTNMEGVPHDPPYMKTQGLAIVKGSTPEYCRTGLKKVVEHLMNDEDSLARDFVQNFYNSYIQKEPDDIAVIQGIGELTKYRENLTDWTPIKGTRDYVRSAFTHNRIMEETKQFDHAPIKDGCKIKFVYLKSPNRSHSKQIGWEETWPTQFDNLKLREYIDYEKTFDRTFRNAAYSYFEAAGVNPVIKVDLDLF